MNFAWRSLTPWSWTALLYNTPVVEPRLLTLLVNLSRKIKSSQTMISIILLWSASTDYICELGNSARTVRSRRIDVVSKQACPSTSVPTPTFENETQQQHLNVAQTPR